ncbi:MAG: hypothetical protein WA820_26105 [Bradyrhizobium sp.]|jgi:hypothetical protein
MDVVRYMQRIKEVTSIYFGNDDAVKVKETSNEILMLRALQGASQARTRFHQGRVDDRRKAGGAVSSRH